MKGFGPIRIIIALAAIAILAGGGLYYWGAYRQNLDITRGNGIIKFLGFSPSNELSPEERKLFEDRGIGIYSDSIDASTWKIYRNEKYGFEVRYPDSFGVKTEIHQTVLVLEDSKIKIEKYFGLPNCYATEELKVSKTLGYFKWTTCGNGWIALPNKLYSILVTVENIKLQDMILESILASIRLN